MESVYMYNTKKIKYANEKETVTAKNNAIILKVHLLFFPADVNANTW